MTSPEFPSVPVTEVPSAALLLDVREDDEWRLGHAPGAVHIPMADIPARADELDYDREVYVVCRQGGRSLQVAQYLARIGYDVVQVTGGMVAWQKAGLPLTAEGDHEAEIY
ncbi:rhodanese-like domain-containing protein [Nocardia sp. NPDC003482]